MHPDLTHRKALVASLFSSVLLAACGGGTDTGTAGADAASADVAATETQRVEVQNARNGIVAAPSPAGTLLGSNVVQSSVDSNPAGMAEAFMFAASANGSSSAVNVYLDASNSAATVTVAVYDNNNGKPGTRLATGTTSVAKAGTWNAIAIPTLGISTGKRYWIAVMNPSGKSGTIRFRDLSSGGASTVTTVETNLTGMPSTWNVGAVYSNTPVSAYLSLDGAGAPPPPPPPPPGPGTAALSWTKSADPTVTGYRVYYGVVPHSYAQKLGNGTLTAQTTYTQAGLQTGVTYYFSVTAIGAGNAESAYSEEVIQVVQ